MCRYVPARDILVPAGVREISDPYARLFAARVCAFFLCHVYPNEYWKLFLSLVMLGEVLP